MTKGIEDFKVFCDEKVNKNWFDPAGLQVWATVREVGPSAFDKMNLRRIFLMLWDSRMPLADSKVSRRSRRRWRGKGGVWQFDPNLFKMFVEAATKVFSDY